MNEEPAGAAGVVSGATVIRFDSTWDGRSERELRSVSHWLPPRLGLCCDDMGRLFPNRQLMRDRCRDDVRGGFHGVVELDLPDARAALLDLLGRDQDLADVLIGLAEMLLQLEHAFLQA